MIINKIIKTLFCCLLISIFSCTNQLTNQFGIRNQNDTKEAEPKMVYLFFEVEKASDGKEVIKLMERKESDGFFKNEEFGTAKDITNSNYKIVLLDKNNKICKTSIIDNPLSPVFESYDKDSIEKQIGKLDKAEFFYRYNDNGNVAEMEIHKVENNNSTLIFKLKL
ncbi:hypothetical protein SAMN05421825_3705 [Epilithonimonas hungarica]|uniref:Lipoprotein n=2 Tax=Epilithonimonas hungarica TaxID=454006 RepID=A0A1G7VPP5_9FLAO|nr:hypothetical protein SAMN05421825_3705 [Epilithonimonas hungarica]